MERIEGLVASKGRILHTDMDPLPIHSRQGQRSKAKASLSKQHINICHVISLFENREIKEIPRTHTNLQDI